VMMILILLLGKESSMESENLSGAPRGANPIGWIYYSYAHVATEWEWCVDDALHGSETGWGRGLH
jgi:hypothetical protein